MVGQGCQQKNCLMAVDNVCVCVLPGKALQPYQKVWNENVDHDELLAAGHVASLTSLMASGLH
jgi:hypothetical protein